MFYGWGQDAVEFPMPDGRKAVCVYKYFSLMFIFKLARKQQWYVVGPDGEHEVKREDLSPLFSPEEAPKLNFWRRFGLLIPVGGVVLLSLSIAWTSRGTTGVNALEAGDCFWETTESEIDRLPTPDCAEPHDSQIIAEIDLDQGPEAMPGDDDAYWESVNELCFDEADKVIIAEDSLPFDTFVLFYTPVDEAWSDGDRRAICYLHSPDGLEENHVAPGG